MYFLTPTTLQATVQVTKTSLGGAVDKNNDAKQEQTKVNLEHQFCVFISMLTLSVFVGFSTEVLLVSASFHAAFLRLVRGRRSQQLSHCETVILNFAPAYLWSQDQDDGCQ